MAEEFTVYVVDDDNGVRVSLALLLESFDFKVKAFDCAEAFLRAWRPGDCGCLVADVRMPGMSGLQLLARLEELKISLPVIVMTGHGDIPMAVKAMKAGALDFIEKPFTEEFIVESVRRAMARNHGLQDNTRSALKKRMAQLSAREREVLSRVVEGKANKVIARELGISVRTVEVHRSNSMQKLEASNLAELVRLALAAGFTDVIGA
jgi:two-component system, LuxR family, response regulator FixJ